MQRALGFLLYAPLQSWGDIAVGDIRNTYRYPSKSALIGLIAAAMGWDRYKDEEQMAELNRNLKFAVRADGRDGPVLPDYHTAQVPPSRKGKVYRTRADELKAEDLETILSTREYLCDSAFTAFCFGPYDVLEESGERLRNPRRPLYLGRKSCPLAVPCVPKIIEGVDLLDIQRQYGFPEEMRTRGWVPLKETGEEARIVWEEGIEPGMTTSTIVRRNDNFISRTLWQFGSRAECVGVVALP